MRLCCKQNYSDLRDSQLSLDSGQAVKGTVNEETRVDLPNVARLPGSPRLTRGGQIVIRTRVAAGEGSG